MEEQNKEIVKEQPKKVNKTKKKSTKPPSNVKKSDFEQLKDDISARKEQKQKAKKQKGVENQKRKAQKRIELARIKAQKKAEKARIKAEKQKELKKKKIEAKALKEERKEKRKERKELLRHETKAQRAKRIREERAKKQQLKKQKTQAKIQHKEQKRQAKERRKEEKAKRKYQRKREKQRGFGGWLAAVITLGVAVLALGTLLTLNYFIPEQTGVQLEGNYQKSYYSFVECVDNMDLNLSKLTVSEGVEEEQRLFVEIIVDSELAENNLSDLPIADENKYNLSRFINQVGDYSKTLNKKLIEGGVLTDKEREDISQMQKITSLLKDSLYQLNVSAEGYDFTKLLNKNSDLINKSFGEMENLSIEYPHLIYDGAFSDSLKNPTLIIEGEEITKSQAVDILKDIFTKYGEIEISSAEESKGDYKVYYLEGNFKDGSNIYATISKNGGKLVQFSMQSYCKQVNVGEDECIQTAKEFIESLDIKNMRPVWIQFNENSATINFSYEQEGVIIYKDLVKVKVCLQDSVVIGLEATSYYSNHKERAIPTFKISKEDALARVSSNLYIYSIKQTLIPFGQTQERAAYEFVGDYNGSTYYVYIDALTGEELQIFKVIDSKDGKIMY